jgi:hypothetical protein
MLRSEPEVTMPGGVPRPKNIQGLNFLLDCIFRAAEAVAIWVRDHHRVASTVTVVGQGSTVAMAGARSDMARAVAVTVIAAMTTTATAYNPPNIVMFLAGSQPRSHDHTLSDSFQALSLTVGHSPTQSRLYI